MFCMPPLQVDEETDRPTDPPIITGVEVLWNPFEDIVPRTTAAERRAQEQFK
jgi:peptidyl-prolyl cis-trans isomerase SDCCAG10